MKGHTLTEKNKENSNLHILLAEDDYINQKVADNLLRHKGYDISIAGNGKEAFHSFLKFPFDLILMDIQMPVMDGFRATRKIREKEKPEKRIPIIAMTAFLSDDFKAKCLSVGMNDYITKPFEIESFYMIISKWERKIVNGNEARLSRYTAPLHIEEALNRTMGDREFLRILLIEFLKELPKHFHILKNALIRKDMKQLSYEAHQLKGVAANLSAHRISDVAKAIETRGMSGDVNGAKQALMVLKTEGYRLHHFIRNEMV